MRRIPQMGGGGGPLSRNLAPPQMCAQMRTKSHGPKIFPPTNHPKTKMGCGCKLLLTSNKYQPHPREKEYVKLTLGNQISIIVLTILDKLNSFYLFYFLFFNCFSLS